MRASARSTAWVLLALGAFIAGSAVAAPPTEGAGAEDAGPAVREETSGDDLLTRRERYFYSSFARRDPFGSLVSGSFARTMGGDLLDIGEITLVGVVWGTDDKFAVVQDRRDHVHVLREGDRVVNGKVIKVEKTSLTAQHYFFGETANVTIHMNLGNQGEGQ